MNSVDNHHDARPSTSLSTKDVLFSNLYLPHMPQLKFASSTTTPMIRLLVCADVDLQSSSALCEFLLEQRNELFDPTTVDMVLVLGPLTSEGDIGSFGSSCHPGLAKPFIESSESAAGRLGMITACLSQLENIVCRVVFLMGTTDPLLLPNATVVDGTDGRPHYQPRLTPNSRCLNQQWLAIAPGLGCAGLSHIEDFKGFLDELKEEHAVTGNTDDDHHNTLDDSDSTSRAAALMLAKRTEHLANINQSYAQSTKDLLQLADPQSAMAKNEQRSQTILVTQHASRSEKNRCRNHERRSTSTNDPRVCFEITTSGCMVDNEKSEVRGNDEARWISPRCLLHPGSLRNRGDFVLVDVGLRQNDSDEDASVCRWEVMDSQFHTLNSFR